MARRNIVQIDEAKCNGCGDCVTACAEGAIQIIDGKARLVSDVYCDGLGACLGHCPQDAITIIEREADEFDEAAVEARLATTKGSSGSNDAACAGSCPGAAVSQFPLNVLPTSAGPSPQSPASNSGEGPASALTHWPVQLKLVPPSAPFLKNADLLLVADCVPFAMADFHERILRGRPVLVGCPKLDDAAFYVEKLRAILCEAQPRGLTVVHMEVPCCTGLMRIAEAACQAVGTGADFDRLVVSRQGVVEGSRIQ